MSETGGLKAIQVPSFCWLSSDCNKIKVYEGVVVASDHLNGSAGIN